MDGHAAYSRISSAVCGVDGEWNVFALGSPTVPKKLQPCLLDSDGCEKIKLRALVFE